MTDSTNNERPLNSLERLVLQPVVTELDNRVALIIREAGLSVEEYGVDLLTLRIVRKPEIDP